MELSARNAKADLLREVRREVRRAPAGNMEVRTADGGLTFRGLASSVESPYDMGWYSETVARGAFTKTLSENPDVVLLANHEGLPLAATRNGSLTLEQTDAGLEFTATADAADPDAARIAAKVESGLLSECSFAFRVTRQDWNEARDERTLQEIDLNRGDVSVVTFGANPNTAVQMRSMLTELDDDALAELRDDPEMLGLMRRLMPEPVIKEEIAPTIITPANFDTFIARAYALRPRS